jgi:hypothetical protein
MLEADLQEKERDTTLIVKSFVTAAAIRTISIHV